jgi:hypothetical protein
MKIKLTDTRVIFAAMMFFAVIAFIDGIFVTDAASLAELTWWGTTSLVIAMVPLVYWLGAFGVGLIKKAYSLFKK